jgi:hypothetical protein
VASSAIGSTGLKDFGPGLLRHAKVLINRRVTVLGLHIWGVPWSPTAKQRRRDFDAIPDDVTVLISHVPALGVLDSGPGDAMLRVTLDRAKPRLFVCGHIHAGRGVAEVGNTTCVNASMLGADGDLCGNPYVMRMSRE